MTTQLVEDLLINDRYRVGALVGAGAMADVYSVLDERLNRRVALKLFKAGATDQARFEQESRLLVGIQHHNVVGVLDAGVHDDLPFVILDLYDHDLTEELRAGPFAPRDAAAVGAAVAQGIAAAHAQGVVHRDVKPSNILLSEDRRVVIADFGVARLVDQTRLTQTAGTIGTPGYLAPEQVTGDAVGAPADVYALGLVLLEALTGERPFPGPYQESLAARINRSPEVPASLPAPWRELLSTMTALDPAERPTADEAARALARLAPYEVDDDATAAVPIAEDATATMAMTQVSARPAPAPRRAAAPSKNWVPVAAAIGIAVLMLGAIVLALGQRDPDASEDPAVATTQPTTATTSPPRTVRTTAPTTPPATDPPATDPPVTEPPVTEPDAPLPTDAPVSDGA
ncbi:MAG: serine/threonine-protein kinase [Acidimicrobiales bacterium]|nr:serine/threonine-protein kinase [Acidimicrobiales bacterium]